LSTDLPIHATDIAVVSSGGVTRTDIGTQATPASQTSGPGKAVKVAWALDPGDRSTDADAVTCRVGE
jgi:hypothetical protein